ncbi:hypothetical protein PRK78_003694 [Emydomyces testavorans]|uniref:Xylanolytic transcriptional activator regulatory domain-containing protein n=1 Tax=Emydomyces testavorans TaxID=2070801 RepID=A0AAF0IJ07_9EURO|nr:hypothetical protein PRK78_003694 [Emydomyces testavorans]
MAEPQDLQAERTPEDQHRSRGSTGQRREYGKGNGGVLRMEALCLELMQAKMPVLGYSPLRETQRIFNLLCNLKDELSLPSDLEAIAKNVEFTSEEDNIYFPIPLKETETASALKGIEVVVACSLANLKYGSRSRKIKINLEHATCFLFQTYLSTIDGLGKYDEDTDFLEAQSNPYRRMSANLYATKSPGAYYHIHGSLEATTTLGMIGLPPYRPDLKTIDDIAQVIESHVQQFTIEELEEKNKTLGQAGVIALKYEDFIATPHGKANVGRPPWTVINLESTTPPVPLPTDPAGTNPRVLQGIKVLELCRVIAGPVMGRILAEYGADVLKVTGPNVPDVPFFQIDVNMGKRTTDIDLKNDEGRAQFEKLLADADIILDGYRPGTFDKLGYGPEALARLGVQRGKGYVYVNENCFGYDGEWAYRPGWQQIADCVSGVAWAQGKFMGLNEPVVPPFPISDYGTGAMGATAAMIGLYHRATKGGSWHGRVSLVQYDLLLFTAGPYEDKVQEELRSRLEESFFALRHQHSVDQISGTVMKIMRARYPHLFQQYRENWRSRGFNADVSIITPVAEIEGVEVSFQRASAPNGTHEPEWSFHENNRQHLSAEQRALPSFTTYDTPSQRNTTLGTAGTLAASPLSSSQKRSGPSLSNAPTITPRPSLTESQAAPTRPETNSGLFYNTTHSEPNEEEPLSEASRMLKDGRGRLLYLGDSASLSYLDTIRRLVEKTIGVSRFTSDPHKHSLVELSISAGLKPTHVLPDREVAEFLIDSFFSTTVGIVQVLDKEAFINEFATIYGNPLQVEQSRLCLLNLVFAVGLQMSQSSAVHGFRGSQILKRLGSDLTERAKIFYLNAAHLNDPISGFEDGDITSIQSLLLITLFMLTVAKRNAAWAYFGMAVRSAYALGLHRKNTMSTFTTAEQRLRRNIWRTMYILDCFLSASLGRPNGINSRDAAELFIGDEDDGHEISERGIDTAALYASVRAARLLGDILSCVYAERKISVKFVEKSARQFQDWKDALPDILHWRNISIPNEDPRTTLAQVHVNLYYFHGIILLTRPFLLQKIVNQARPAKDSVKSPEATSGLERPPAQTDSFSAACVRAAFYSIEIVQSAILKRALPRRDPFVIYWLFTASLIVLSNAFCKVYGEGDNRRIEQTSLELHIYLAETDPLAQRYLQILTAFHEAISSDSSQRVASSCLGYANQAIFSSLFEDKPRALDGKSRSHSNSLQPMEIADREPSQFDQASHMGNAPAAEGQPGNSSCEPVQMSPNMNTTEISPPDYSLDFDNYFLNLVSQGDAPY